MAQQNNSNVRKDSNTQGSSSNRKRKKKPKFRLSSVFFIFFVVYIASFFAYMVQANANNEIPTKEDSIFSKGDSEPQESIETTTPEVEDNSTIPVVNPVPESVSVTDDYLNSCMFIGDSISEGFSGYYYLDDANVLAKKGLRPDTVCTEVISSKVYGDVLAIDGIVQSGFKNIYIMLGSNGIGWVKNENMINGYRQFINEINEKVQDANVYIVSMPPVTAKKEDTNEYPTIEDGLVYNSTIDELNELYLNLANELNVHYLDINSYLKDDTGKLPYDSSTDGMHFDGATYRKVLDYVCSHIAE